MGKRITVALLAVLVLSIAVPCSISYASNTANVTSLTAVGGTQTSESTAQSVYAVPPDNFATSQLQEYLEGYSLEYQNYGFASQGDMENARIGTPVNLYRFDQTGIESYTNGDLPLVDNHEWLFPVYGINNQIENAIRISSVNGTPYSVFGGFGATFLKDFFQENDDLAQQADSNSLKVILEENLSTLFFTYKQNGKSLTIPYIFNPDRSYGLQNKTAYDTDTVGQDLKAIQVKHETYLKNFRASHPNAQLVGGGGIGVSPTSNGHQETLFSLWVLMALGVAACAIYLIRRIGLSTNKGL